MSHACRAAFLAFVILATTTTAVWAQATGQIYPGDDGFPGIAGMERDWLTLTPRVGLAWDPNADGRTSVRVGYGMNSDNVTGQFFFDAQQAPPFGLEQRLTRPDVGLFDDPWGRCRPSQSLPGHPGPGPGVSTGLPLHFSTARSDDHAHSQLERRRPAADPYGDRSLSSWLNPAAFAQPALGTYGTSLRNAYEGPGSRVVDLALVRSFQFLQTHRLEARVEAFNAFNWFRWGNPTTNLNNANFGRILSAGDPRVMQFALKYSF